MASLMLICMHATRLCALRHALVLQTECMVIELAPMG